MTDRLTVDEARDEIAAILGRLDVPGMVSRFLVAYEADDIDDEGEAGWQHGWVAGNCSPTTIIGLARIITRDALQMTDEEEL